MQDMDVRSIFLVGVDFKNVLAFAPEHWTHISQCVNYRSSGLQILIFLAVGLQIRPNDVRDLVSQLGLDELAVQAGDVGDGLVLGADGLAGAGVGAVAEAGLFHGHDHGLGTTGGLYSALGKEGELGDLRRDEEHGGTVLTGGDAGATADAGSAVHGLVGILLGDEDGVGILGLTSSDGGVAPSLDDLVEGVAVNHTVLNHGEGGRAPRLHGDDVAIVEAAHVELTRGGTTLGLAVRRTVDVE